MIRRIASVAVASSSWVSVMVLAYGWKAALIALVVLVVCTAVGFAAVLGLRTPKHTEHNPAQEASHGR